MQPIRTSQPTQALSVSPQDPSKSEKEGGKRARPLDMLLDVPPFYTPHQPAILHESDRPLKAYKIPAGAPEIEGKSQILMEQTIRGASYPKRGELSAAIEMRQEQRNADADVVMRLVDLEEQIKGKPLEEIKATNDGRLLVAWINSEEVALDRLGFTTEQMFLFLRRHGEELRYFELEGCSAAFIETCLRPGPDPKLAPQVALNLTHLYLPGCEIDDSFLKTIIDLCPNLKELDLSKTSITEMGIKEFRRLPQLTGLYLSECDLGLASAQIIGQITTLTRLNLSQTQIGDEGLAALSDLKNLERLVLDCCDFSFEANWQILSSLVKLKSLSVAGNLKLRNFDFLRPLRNLEALDVGALDLEDDMLEPITELIQLKELVLTHSRLVVAPNLSNLTNLETLDLTGTDPEDFLTFIGEIETLRNLTNLSVARCRVGPNELAMIAQLPQLQNLDISNNPLKSEDLMLLGPLQKLRHLAVGGDEELFDDDEFPTLNEAASRAIARLQNLSSLTFSGALEGNATASLTQLKQLRHLAITTNTLDALNARPLSQLDLESFELNLWHPVQPVLAPLVNLTKISLKRLDVATANQLAELPRLKSVKSAEIAPAARARLARLLPPAPRMENGPTKIP